MAVLAPRGRGYLGGSFKPGGRGNLGGRGDSGGSFRRGGEDIWVGGGIREVVLGRVCVCREEAARRMYVCMYACMHVCMYVCI